MAGVDMASRAGRRGAALVINVGSLLFADIFVELNFFKSPAFTYEKLPLFRPLSSLPFVASILADILERFYKYDPLLSFAPQIHRPNCAYLYLAKLEAEKFFFPPTTLISCHVLIYPFLVENTHLCVVSHILKAMLYYLHFVFGSIFPFA